MSVSTAPSGLFNALSRLAAMAALTPALCLAQPASAPTEPVTPTDVGAVISTSSGLVFKLVRQGKGPSPQAFDTVKVHYRGTFPDGTEFDSSYKRGRPAEFPLARVIKCWTEGVQRLQIGGMAQLTCPPAIAYGPNGRSGIPPNATLHFEVELLEISRLAASCARYENYSVNGDGTVTDPRTGIIWQQCYSGQRFTSGKCIGTPEQGNWFKAMRQASQDRFLGKNDWRLPTLQEFESIVDASCSWEGSNYQKAKTTPLLSQVNPNETSQDHKIWYYELWTSSISDAYSNVWPGASFGSTAAAVIFYEARPGSQGALKLNSNASFRFVRGGSSSAKRSFDAKLIALGKGDTDQRLQAEIERWESARPQRPSNSDSARTSGGHGGVVRLEQLDTGGFSLSCADGLREVLHPDKDYRSGRVSRYCADFSAGGHCSSNPREVAENVCK